MDERIKNHLIQFAKVQEWPHETDEDIFELLREAGYKKLYREEVEQHRWWNIYLYVVEINGMLIGFDMAEANRDESMEDLGWDFDLNSVREMVKTEKTVVTYKAKESPCDSTE